jgi:hypothetical protein
MNLNDVGMLESGNCLSLGHKADCGFGICVRASENHLQSARSIEPDLSGVVDNAHRAAAKLCKYLISRYRRHCTGRWDRSGLRNPEAIGRG